MRKYFFILKSEVMSSLQYMKNVVLGFLGYFILLFILIQLWQYLYQDPSKLIHGYTMIDMIWYVILTEVLWSCLGGRQLCMKICNDVKGGNIAYNLCKPYSYIGYSVASHLGSIAIKGVVYTILAFLLGFVFLGKFPQVSIVSILIVIISSILATIINTLLIICIGLFSFKVEDANPFYWLYSKFILILGTLFPIEFFPALIRPILQYSPIFAVTYGPAKLFVHFTWQGALEVFLVQGIYLGLAVLLCTYIYRKGVKNLNVNGG